MPAFDLKLFAANMVKAAMCSLASEDDATLKSFVMTARQHGHLSDEETEFYIAAWGLVEA